MINSLHKSPEDNIRHEKLLSTNEEFESSIKLNDAKDDQYLQNKPMKMLNATDLYTSVEEDYSEFADTGTKEYEVKEINASKLGSEQTSVIDREDKFGSTKNIIDTNKIEPMRK